MKDFSQGPTKYGAIYVYKGYLREGVLYLKEELAPCGPPWPLCSAVGPQLPSLMLPVAPPVVSANLQGLLFPCQSPSLIALLMAPVATTPPPPPCGPCESLGGPCGNPLMIIGP